MTKASLLAIFARLNGVNVRYLVVGGLAVAAHGYGRTTIDLDLVLAFDETNLQRALTALQGLGYTPRNPVRIEEFADSQKRQDWIENKHMLVFTLVSSAHQDTPIDLFIKAPFEFERAYKDAGKYALSPTVEVTVCSLPDLFDLKRTAGRPKDLLDIDMLNRLHPKKEA